MWRLCQTWTYQTSLYLDNHFFLGELLLPPPPPTYNSLNIFSLAVKEVIFFTLKLELLAIDTRVHHSDTGAKLCFIVELQILFYPKIALLTQDLQD
jgi:hypothetical protein